MVGLSRAGLGRLLGLGPGRECRALTLANGNRFPALDDGARTARYAQGVEPGPGHPLFCPLDLWHVRGTQRHHQFSTFLCLFEYWRLFSGISWHSYFLFFRALYLFFSLPPAFERN